MKNTLSYENAILTSIVAGSLALASAVGLAAVGVIHHALMVGSGDRSILELMEMAVDQSPETVITLGLISFTATAAVLSSLLVNFLSAGAAKLELVPAAAVMLVSATLALSMIAFTDFELSGALGATVLLAASALGFRQFTEEALKAEAIDAAAAEVESEE